MKNIKRTRPASMGMRLVFFFYPANTHLHRVIDNTKEHHLLGLQNTKALCAIAQDFPWITSIDTSNPIITGFLGNRYKSFGNAGESKPETKLESILEESLDDHDISNIKHNVRIFRNIVDPIKVDDPR